MFVFTQVRKQRSYLTLCFITNFSLFLSSNRFTSCSTYYDAFFYRRVRCFFLPHVFRLKYHVLRQCALSSTPTLMLWYHPFLQTTSLNSCTHVNTLSLSLGRFCRECYLDPFCKQVLDLAASEYFWLHLSRHKKHDQPNFQEETQMIDEITPFWLYMSLYLYFLFRKEKLTFKTTNAFLLEDKIFDVVRVVLRL